MNASGEDQPPVIVRGRQPLLDVGRVLQTARQATMAAQKVPISATNSSKALGLDVLRPCRGRLQRVSCLPPVGEFMQGHAVVAF